MAAEIKKKIREIDFFARIGGEEFLILAPETEPEKAVNLAEKIRETVAATTFPEAGPVTVSLGVAQFCAGDRADLLLKRVDQALTRAKAQRPQPRGLQLKAAAAGKSSRLVSFFDEAAANVAPAALAAYMAWSACFTRVSALRPSWG